MGIRELRRIALLVSLAPLSGEAGLAAQESAPRYVDAASEAGIEFVHSMGSATVETILQSTGSGLCFADYDGDGAVDLFFVNAGSLGAAATAAAASRLYRSLGAGTFEDVTSRAGVGNSPLGQGCVFGDYDNDGDQDLYVTRYGPNQLYRNRGDGSFVEVAEASGVAEAAWSTGAAFGDCDGDGDLDLFVANYLDYRPGVEAKRSRLSAKEGYTTFPGPRDYAGQPDRLYRNEGDGRFSDISAAAGIDDPEGKGLQASFLDADLDGNLDVYVANDRTANFLYAGRGDCTFEETALASGVAVDERGDATGAMGLAFADFDRDGLQDLLVTNMVFEYNALYHNLGGGTFEDVTRRAGLAERTYGFVGWGAEFLDYDNDGDSDLVVVNGHVHDHVDIFSDSVTFEQSNLLFANLGDGRFRDVTRESGGALGELNVSRGLAVGDYDQDGDPDLAINNLDSAAMLLRNEGGNERSWIAFSLLGSRSNRDAVGSRIVVRSGAGTQSLESRSGSSYLSQNERRTLVGLGDSDLAELVEVHWPGGATLRLEDLRARRTYHILERAESRLRR